MLFNSIAFVVFFPIVVGVYFLTPVRWRWCFMLAASYYFYMCWKAEYVVLIIIATLIDYVAALRMSRLSEPRRRRKYLLLCLFTNLGLLFGFKYFNFFNDSLRATFERFDLFYDVPAFDVLLPVGISFYTFQALSYTIDVYRGQTRPERHIGIFALYVAFWPQLVAGPIERSDRLLPQLHRTVVWDDDRVRAGLLRMLWGFFKKIVIADRLAETVSTVYNAPGEHDGASLLLATYFFAFQIYCDFSGYSDIAIGSARVLGIDLMENFKRPYFSRSIAEFWSRWHISLSTWFRDYVYIPLGGNRTVKWRWYYNLFITFLVSGLWHGANWTFVVWGALHGAYLIAAIVTAGMRRRLLGPVYRRPGVKAVAQMVITFHLVLLGWVFFRANDLGDALLILERIIFTPWTLGIAAGQAFALLFAGLMIALLLAQEGLVRDATIESVLLPRARGVRWAYYGTVSCCILWFGVFNHNEFIYFQF